MFHDWMDVIFNSQFSAMNCEERSLRVQNNLVRIEIESIHYRAALVD